MLVAIFILMHMVTRNHVWETDVEKLLEILPNVIGRLVFVSDSSECIVLLSKEGVPEHGVKLVAIRCASTKIVRFQCRIARAKGGGPGATSLPCTFQ